jgi:hypothetical protein
VSCGRISYRGIPPWRRVLKPNANIADAMRNLKRGDDISGTTQLVPPDSFKIQCIHCTCDKQVCNITLVNKGKWSPITCLQCFERYSSRRWNCSCGHSWIGCQLHAPAGFSCKSKPRAKRGGGDQFLFPGKRNQNVSKQNDPPPTLQASRRKRPHPDTQAAQQSKRSFSPRAKARAYGLPAAKTQTRKRSRPHHTPADDPCGAIQRLRAARDEPYNP